MKLNDCIHGFTVTEISEVKEIAATLYSFEHKKTGAKLVYIDRKDECKSFAIGFRTIPKDDTGVFHILEHSVLCGSRKFPVKEPFTELLKSSLNTFMNALTYSDKTLYPISSRNEKDFFNLVDVYMDAVFNPKALENEFIFMQEGWRYELDESGRLSVNGVVYNEMKGAYSSSEEYADYLISKLLYKGGTYGLDSGGNPDAIPTLSYEDFKAAHSSFYHPSNAYILLDGSVDLDKALKLISDYLEPYDKRVTDFEVERGESCIGEVHVADYEIEEEDDPKDKTRVLLSYPVSSFDECVKNNTLVIICDTVADSNEAVLKKKILFSGLCEDVHFYAGTGSKYCTLNVEFRGVKDGCENEVIEVYRKTLREIISEGIPTELLASSINLLEFKTREADFGSYPKGIVYLLSVYDMWLYGYSPADSLRYDFIFDSLRERIGTSYYTDLLEECTEKNGFVTLIMHPSTTLGRERAEAHRKALDELYEKMSEEQKQELIKKNEQFELWQATPDTEEALAALPTLTLRDLGEAPRETPTKITEADGVTVLNHEIETNGITYVELLFDASDTELSDYAALKMLGLMLPVLDTDTHTSNELRGLIKGHLGSLSLTVTPIKNGENGRLYFSVKTSLLEREKDKAIELLSEYLYKTNLDNKEAIRRKLTQLRTVHEDGITSNGLSYAITRAGAKYDVLEVEKEYLSGYEFYRSLKEMTVKLADGSAMEAFIRKLCTLRDKILTRPRLLLAITGKFDQAFAEKLVAFISPDGDAPTCTEIPLMEKKNEGIAIPSPVSYAVLASNIFISKENLYTGAYSTLTTMLNYETLWEEIRLKGGAYGTGFFVRANSGSTAYHSYRDPSPKRSLECFLKAPSEIRELIKNTPDLTKYVIGTVGATESVMTPGLEGSVATNYYLSGKSYDDVIRARQEIINTTKDELLGLTLVLDEIYKDSTATVVGPREKLSDIDLIDTILEI